MPIGAIIGGGLALGGAILSSKAQNKAADKAADTALGVASQNNALAANIYRQNQAALSPFMQRGNAAGNAMNALLGLGQQSLPTQQPLQQNALQGYHPNVSRLASFKLGGYDNFNVPQQQVPQQQTGPTTQQAADNAFDIFRNSTGYRFRLGEGMDALNSGYAGAGTLQSGAAMKAAQEYGQNFASNEFGNYMNYLGNQQGVGLGGASALAGVGQNYVNTISNNNNSAGTARANAALIQGQNNPFANALGMVGGSILGRGF